jgi:predicted dinucleotide-binding enzyme
LAAFDVSGRRVAVANAEGNPVANHQRNQSEGDLMKVGIIGAGRIGQAAATRLVSAGHEVLISNSRGPASLEPLVASLGHSATAGSAEDAAKFGDVVLVATPLSAISKLPAEQLKGKTVIDANNYYPARDGQHAELDSGELGSSELLARELRSSTVVKAFNTIYSERLRDAGAPKGSPFRLALPVAGDDQEAKALVMGLIDDMGFDAVDAGSLRDGRRQEPGTTVYNRPLDAQGVAEALKQPVT